MVKLGNTKITHILALLAMAVCLFSISGCEPPPIVEEETPTGNVTVVVQKEVKSADSGEVSIVAERIEEIAEKSTQDKGSSSLMTAQRVVTPGCMFSSYHVGKDDLIV